jgi:hypothetical protein
MSRILAASLALAAAAFPQSEGLKVVLGRGAADALGGKNRILAVRTLVMEGAGIAPNIGRNPFPEGPLPT